MYPPPRALAAAHAGYLIATGVWPLLHRRSFERVTGEKTEFWLVRTVGGLAAAVGLALAVSVAKGSKTAEAATLALATGVAFGAADVRAARSESAVYLGDLVLQLAFAPAWLSRWNEAAGSRPLRRPGAAGAGGP